MFNCSRCCGRRCNLHQSDFAVVQFLPGQFIPTYTFARLTRKLLQKIDARKRLRIACFHSLTSPATEKRANHDRPRLSGLARSVSGQSRRSAAVACTTPDGRSAAGAARCRLELARLHTPVPFALRSAGPKHQPLLLGRWWRQPRVGLAPRRPALVRLHSPLRCTERPHCSWWDRC